MFHVASPPPPSLRSPTLVPSVHRGTSASSGPASKRKPLNHRDLRTTPFDRGLAQRGDLRQHGPPLEEPGNTTLLI